MYKLLILLTFFATTSCKTLPDKVKGWKKDFKQLEVEAKDYKKDLREAVK